MKDVGRALIQQPDFLWNDIVGAFSAWGGSSGWDRLTTDPENVSRLAYGALAQLDPAERHGQIHDALKRAGIRWPNRKARLLARCFERAESLHQSVAGDAGVSGWELDKLM